MNLLLLRVAIVLVGLFPLAVVILKARGHRRLMRTGVKTHGTVRQVLGSSDDNLNVINIEYQTDRGPILTRVRVAGLPYKVGQQLPLIHAADDPQRMMLGWRSVHPLLIGLTGAIAIFFLIFAVKLDEI